MAKLVLAKSDNISKEPFVFISTEVFVYTLEEAAFHLYYFWKESFEEFMSEKFYLWVKARLNTIGKSFYRSDKPSVDYINFLKFFDFFDEKEIIMLEKNLSKWENTNLWVQLKENGDNAFSKKRYFNALNYYLKAADLVDNYKIYNNIGLCYKFLGKYQSSCLFLEKAYEISPTEKAVIINLIEAYILDKNTKMAYDLLREQKEFLSEDIIIYFQGKIFAVEGNYNKALEKYYLACKINFTLEYLFEYIDLCIEMRLFAEAENFIEQFPSEDAEIILKKADIFAKGNNIKKAIDLLLDKRYLMNLNIMVKLASYYRLVYNLSESRIYIDIAKSIDENNLYVKLENAYILKYEGKFKEYNILISNILEDIKYKYRCNEK